MKLSKSEFRKWLNAMPKNNIVGYRNRCCYCPIATFIETTKGPFERVDVDDCTIYIQSLPVDKRDHRYPSGTLLDTPKWASKFINKIDRAWFIGKPYNRKISPVRAGEALKVLSNV